MADLDTTNIPSTWKEASTLGVPRYRTGKPCAQGHIADRWTNGRGCTMCCRTYGAKTNAKKILANPEWKEAKNAAARAWKKANPDKVKKHQDKWYAKRAFVSHACNKRWRANNPEAFKAKTDAWRKANPEKCRQSVKDWETRNPKRAIKVKAASKQNRRTRVTLSGGSCTGDDIANLYLRQNSLCAGCGKQTKLTVDHIMPIYLGGSSNIENLQLLCMPCNRSKGRKHPEEWLRSPATQS